MKPATVQPDASQVVETTTTRRIRPADANQEPKPVDFWQYIAAIPAADWQKHIVYLYRVEPQPSVPLQRTGSPYLTFAGGAQIPLTDQQEIEFALAQHYGGGTFRFICKRGAQWVAQERVTISGPVRAVTVSPDAGAGAPGISTGAATILPAGDSNAAIAGKAIDVIAGQEHQAVRIGIDALGAAAQIVRQFGDGRPAPAGPMDELQRLMLQAVIARLTADPMEQFVKMFALLRELNPAGGSGGNSLTDKILTTAVERFMNPPPAGAPVSASAELMRQLPQLGSQVAESLREFRMAQEAQVKAREAEVRIVAMQRGQVAPPPAPQVIPPAIPQNAQMPNQPAGPEASAGAPTMEFVERKIVEILNRPVSAEQAADDAMAFLDPIAPGAIDQLAQLGEQGMVQLFTARPVLKQATANMPRLIEFIRAFLKLYAEDQAASTAGTPPNGSAAKQPLPN